MWWGCGEACTGACTQLCGDQSDIALAGVAGHQWGGVWCGALVSLTLLLWMGLGLSVPGWVGWVRVGLGCCHTRQEPKDICLIAIWQ